MSLVWTLIASFLYVEIVVVLFLVLPIASPTKWQRFFKSRFLSTLGSQAQIYFYLLLGVLVLFLLEAIREMRKYSQEPGSAEHLNIEMQHNMRLFRAQRNFYISGFAIFLTLVIRRLVTLISSQATLLAQSEASLRQAQSATTAARTLLSQQKKQEEESVDGEELRKDEDQSKFKQKIEDLEAELKRERLDKEAMKSQSVSLNKEYDRLTEEYSKLQKKLTVTSGKQD